MTHAVVGSAALPPRPAGVAMPTVPALDAPLARRVLWEAILIGVAADALLRTGMTGLAFPLFVGVAALAFIALTWRAGRRASRETAAWLATAVLLAATVAWRDDPLLQAAGILTAAGALLMAAIATYQPQAALVAPRVRDLLQAALSRVATATPGLLPLVFREAGEPHESARAARRLMPALRAALLALVLVLVFGALLRAADPIFASLVALPDVDIGVALSHVVMTSFFAWLAAGWTRAALDQREPSTADLVPPFPLGTTEITAALGALDLLFALYVLAQLGWFFGGEQFLRDRTGLTAAEYARQGFFQVVWVALLVVPVLLATRAMLADEPGLPRRHARLSLPLVGLVLAIIVSAAMRMRLYVHYYGLTIDRMYALVFLGWIAALLAWLALTVLRGRGERFVAGALVSALVALLVLDVASPDVIVARVNVARAAAVAPDADHQLDLGNLAMLGGEASRWAVAATLEPARTPSARPARATEDLARCTASSRLIGRWGPESHRAAARRQDGAWRSWNAGEVAGLDAVGLNISALRAVQHDACAGSRGARRAGASGTVR